MNRALKIDPELENVVPKMSDDELQLLEEQILRDGKIISPIITWNGVIVDGHNRYKIAMKHPEIPFAVIEKDFDCKDSAIIWICKTQLGRRNLSEQAKRYLIGKKYEAEKHCEAFLGNQYTQKGKMHLPHFEHGTRSRIAKECGVSDTTVARAYDFSRGLDSADETSPGFREKVLSGKIKVTVEEVTGLYKLSKEKRTDEIERLLAPADSRPEKKNRTATETEKMTYKKFRDYYDLMMIGINSVNHAHKDEANKSFEKIGKWALETLEAIFEDTEQNIRRWLKNETCIYNCRRTGNKVSIRIAPTPESLYRFLVYCYQDRYCVESSEDLLMALLLDTSQIDSKT